VIISGLFLTCRNLYQFTCTEQKAPDNSKVHGSLQNCGLSVGVICFVSPFWRPKISEVAFRLLVNFHTTDTDYNAILRC